MIEIGHFQKLLTLLKTNIVDVLSWLQGPEKCNSKFHIFKRFDSDWSPHE